MKNKDDKKAIGDSRLPDKVAKVEARHTKSLKHNTRQGGKVDFSKMGDSHKSEGGKS